MALSITVAAPCVALLTVALLIVVVSVHRVTEVMKGIAAKWRELNDDDKGEWMTKATADKER